MEAEAVNVKAVEAEAAGGNAAGGKAAEAEAVEAPRSTSATLRLWFVIGVVGRVVDGAESRHLAV